MFSFFRKDFVCVAFGIRMNVDNPAILSLDMKSSVLDLARYARKDFVKTVQYFQDVLKRRTLHWKTTNKLVTLELAGNAAQILNA